MFLKTIIILQMTCRPHWKRLAPRSSAPFADALRASETLDVDPPNCALIDLNLGQGISFHVPRELLRRAIPFAFVTGYDRTAIPQEFAAVPRLGKPVAEQQAGKIVERLLAAQPTRRTSA